MANNITQEFIEIDQTREGVLMLKNRSLRGILMTSSLNFALKAESEQNAIIYQFQNFLNSLDFSAQIVVQSRRLNFTGYLDKLKEIEAKQESELLAFQTKEYRSFIGELIQDQEIMAKHFFVVVPFTLTEIPGFKKSREDTWTEERFARARTQLWQRMEFVALGLRRTGLEVAPLRSSEMIELFWSLYHPEEAEVGYYPEIPPELIQ